MALSDLPFDQNACDPDEDTRVDTEPTVYCAVCGDEEVELRGDVCITCQREERAE